MSSSFEVTGGNEGGSKEEEQTEFSVPIRAVLLLSADFWIWAREQYTFLSIY